ncbi:uncharacterized protein LOC134855045 [Symsagittifera roscoffensis]|uniref:uncharacterized protein LOC134855045 n=1 Tax=Symsagittifera roscoffensis TaxID=84072 RepID=UPI00307C0350
MSRSDVGAFKKRYVPKPNKYIVLMGDVGSGKSTILEQLTGAENRSSASSKSYTRATAVISTKDGSLVVADTPGSNPIDDPFQHNLHIMHAINFMPVNCILNVVKADQRTDNVISKIIQYSSRFIPEDLPPELLGVCITHMDQVTWNNQECLDLLKRKAGIRSAVFCGLNTSKTDLRESIMRQIKRKPARNINIDKKLFLKIFDIADGNIKIMRDTRNELKHLQKITEVFYEEREKFAEEDQVDLIFEFQAWVLEKITDAQVRVSNSNNFTFLGPTSASEAGHIANMTNQMRKIIAGIRVEASKYYKDVDSNFRKCPHCSLVWQKIEGCDGSTECGARPSTDLAHDLRRAADEMATFSFCYDYSEYRFQVTKSDTKKQLNVKSYDNSGKGIGCGKRVKWSKMAPVRAPECFDVTVMDNSYTGDINPLPPRASRRFGATYEQESKKLPTLEVEQGKE